MACYGCGSVGGSEVQLCPKCNAARLAAEKPFSDSVLTQYNMSWRLFFDIIAGDVKRMTIVGGMMAAAILAFLCFSDLGPGWLTSGAFFERACASRAYDSQSGDEAARAAFAKGNAFERLLGERLGPEPATAMTLALQEGQGVLCHDLRLLCRDPSQKDLCPQLKKAMY